MTRPLPRKDRLEPDAPDLRPDLAKRLDLDPPPARRWLPTHQGVIRWAHDVGVPQVTPWSAAFTIRHQVRSQNIADDGGPGTNLDGWRDPLVLPVWGEPVEWEGGWEQPYAVRLEGTAENTIDFALVENAAWSDPPFGAPKMQRRHLRPDHLEEAFPFDDTSGATLQVVWLIWHRRV